jgi:predicted PurR-regulated permease PerM
MEEGKGLPFHRPSFILHPRRGDKSGQPHRMSFPPPSPKQAHVIWLAVTGLAIATLVALVVALIWGLGKVLPILSPVLWPIAVAGVLAYLLDPVVDFFERRKVPRTRAIILVFVLALMVVAGLVSSVVPQLVVETRTLTSRIPEYVTKTTKRIENWTEHPPAFLRQYLFRGTNDPAAGASTNLNPAAISPAPAAGVETNPPAAAETGAVTNTTIQVLLIQGGTTNVLLVAAPSATGAPGEANAPLWQSLFTQANVKAVTRWLSSTLPKAGSWLFGQVVKVTSIFGVLAGLALIPIYAFYFLLEKQGISKQWQDYLPVTDSKFKEELVFVLNSINDYLIAFFRGQVVVAICDGALYTIGFTVIGLPYALLIGVMATMLTMIPFIGAMVTCATALVIAVVNFGDWLHPLLVLLVFGIVQALEGTVISPKIMGDRVGLHPLAIIIALMVGTTLLGGLLGGILAIPLTAALRVIMFRYIWKPRQNQGP